MTIEHIIPEALGGTTTENIDGSQILGKTACGRATVVALNMNNAEIVITRKLWVSAGWWPLDD